MSPLLSPVILILLAAGGLAGEAAVKVSHSPGAGMTLTYEGKLETSVNLIDWVTPDPQPPSPLTLPLGQDRIFYRAVSKPEISTIAIMGDSITAQNFSLGNMYPESGGYAIWARALSGSRFNFATDGTNYRFATGGAGTVSIGANHLPQVIAAAPDACFVHEGTNDYSGHLTPDQSAANIKDHWLALRAAGIVPIGSTILPQVAHPAKSAWMVQTNARIRAHAKEHGVLLCDWTGALENPPHSNTGIGSLIWTPDNVHPGHAGAARLGRILSHFLELNCDLRFDPWAGVEAVTRNPGFTGSLGQPEHWNAPSIPVGASVISKELIPDPETGGNWWQLEVSQGSATNLFTVQLNFSNEPSLAGRNVFMMADVEVVSGSFHTIRGRRAAADSTYDLANGTVQDSAGVTHQDGIITLRTYPRPVPDSTSYYSPTISFAGTGVIRFRRAGLYVLPADG